MPPEKGKRILIVDDETAFCETLKARLESFGYGVSTASSSSQAWQEILRSTPNLILLDIRMPEEDGYTFLRKLRSFRHAEDPAKEENIRKIPIIVVTGVGEGMKTLFEQERIAAYVTKPIDSSVLKKLIEENI